MGYYVVILFSVGAEEESTATEAFQGQQRSHKLPKIKHQEDHQISARMP